MNGFTIMEAELVCGICHDETLIELGEIDCCDHRFCYPCIAKWAEIESKCPFCKLRFKTLTRIRLDPPLKEGLSVKGRLAGTVISKAEVPEKDQRVVFEDPQFLEWLEGLSCIICNGSEQEDQLLLCDGCDQACHTFCLGLSTVPEDAWFCSHCQTARDTPAMNVTELSESPYNGNNRRLRRRISRSRPYSIIDSDEESAPIQDSEGIPSPEEIPETVERPTYSRILRRRNIEVDTRFRRTSMRGNATSDSRLGLQEDYQRAERMKRNWDSLREGRLRFEDIIEPDEYVDLVSPATDGKRETFPAQLKSPRAQTPEEAQAVVAKDKFSPPLLDLRSRLRLQLLNHESLHVGIPNEPVDMTTPTSSIVAASRNRTLPNSWRNGRVTTLGDLSFGASVAAGRVTPRSRGMNSTQNTSPTPGRLFAHKTQAMVHAAVARSGGQRQDDESNIEYEGRRSRTPPFESFKMTVPMHDGSYPTKMQTSRRNSASPSKMAHTLVREQLSITFRSVSLPRKMESFIRDYAVKCLIESHSDNMNAENASAMVDEALEAYSKQN